MGFRFQRRIRLLPGITMNMGKNGSSFSFGPRGAKVTVGKDGVRKTFGIFRSRYHSQAFKREAMPPGIDVFGIEFAGKL